MTPGFFEAIRDRIVMGRPIVDTDYATARRVAVINEVGFPQLSSRRSI